MAKVQITLEQEEYVVRLYRSGKYTIKQIMSMTGVRSEQTIYRILDAEGVPRQISRKPVRKLSITIDEDVSKMIDMEKPKNLSEWVCERIKKEC